MLTIIAYVFPKLQTPKDVVRPMCKNSFFRRPFHKQHDKRSQTLLKSFTAANLPYLLIALKGIELEKVFLSDI